MRLPPASPFSSPPPQQFVVTFSPSWTLVPTHWCRNACGYCAFVERDGARAELLSPAAARAEIERAARAGATELLVMSGEGVEESKSVREALRRFGFDSYLDYLLGVARDALAHDLLPHVNVGNLDESSFRALRPFVPSMGMMLETVERGLRVTEAHRRAPDKDPVRRLETLRAAGRARVPFTTGLLVGCGESTASREESLRAIAGVHAEHGHVQEVIVQPFTPHSGTAMTRHPPPSFAELRDVVAMARGILPPEVFVQVPPNLTPRFFELVEAGARDLGGVSPDGDRINPAQAWLEPRTYAAALRPRGFRLRARLAVHEQWATDEWLAPETLKVVPRVRPRLPDFDNANSPRRNHVAVTQQAHA